MFLKIEHHTSYHYSRPVFVEPQHLYFYPQLRNHLKLVNHELQINPNPAGQGIRLDPENNSYTQCWFNEMIDSMEFVLKMTIETTTLNQFNFFLENEAKTPYQEEALKIYRTPTMPLKEEVVSWVNAIERADPNNFLANLCAAMYDKWDHSISMETELLDPNTCFAMDSGSCRDLSWMMIQMLRLKNYPARYVSGYSYNPEIEGHELHAWVEVWLPGAGWIGLDPSSGLFITEYYIPMATSYHPSNTLPVQGQYRGDASARLDTAVTIEVIDK